MSTYNQLCFYTLHYYRWNYCLKVCLLTLISVVLCSQSFASQIQPTMKDLIAEKRVRISVSPRIDKSVVPKERITFDVKVESQFPFNRDMVLPYLNISDTVIVNEKSPVVRSTYRRGGKRWYTQTSTFSLYAMRSGDFVLSRFDLPLSVTVPNGDVIEGNIESHSVEFYVDNFGESEALMQSGVVSDKATLSLSMKQNKEKMSTKDVFEVGQAVTLTYRVSVENSHSVLLPQLKIEDVDGIIAYRKPANKEDILNPLTNDNTAVLSQSFTYVFQNEGTFKLPEKTLSWWNTNTKRVETLKTSPLTFQVGEPSIAEEVKANVLQWFGRNFYTSKGSISYSDYVVAITLFLSFLSFLLFAYQRGEVNRQDEQRMYESRDLKQAFLEQCDRADYIEAVQTLYDIATKLDVSRASLSHVLDKESNHIWQKILAMAFNGNAARSISQGEAQKLIHALTASGVSRPTKFKFDWTLNPVSE
ncbi:BatD family protein [Vibrio campbellii]|uniref:BatD family protein n=1 Tax=Vibrio campbellii TaxID=680 RepID=UPI0005EED694|nr:BatD family protein [Vibrio campbellii]